MVVQNEKKRANERRKRKMTLESGQLKDG